MKVRRLKTGVWKQFPIGRVILSSVLSFLNWSGQVHLRTCLYKLQLLHLYKKTTSNGGYKIRNPEGIHFITIDVVEWVDVFTRKEYRDILLDSIQYCRKKKGLLVYAWCLMINHFHLVVGARHKDTSDILRDFKKFTCKQIIRAIAENQKESRRDWMLEIFRKAGTPK